MGKVRLAPESLDPDGEPSEATIHGLSRLLPRSRAALIFRGIRFYVVDLMVGDEGLEPPTPSV
jgi:hypothetical protein